MCESWSEPVRYDRLIALLDEPDKSPMAIAYEDGVILKFDWPAWMDEGRAYLEPGGIEGADLEVCRKLLTVLVRQDRFVENSLEGACKAGGPVARIIRRIKELVE